MRDGALRRAAEAAVGDCMAAGTARRAGWMACCAVLAACSATTTTRLIKAPPKPADCKLRLYTSEAEIDKKRAYRVLGVIEHRRDVGDINEAIRGMWDEACALGADALLVSSKGGGGGGVWSLSSALYEGRALGWLPDRRDEKPPGAAVTPAELRPRRGALARRSAVALVVGIDRYRRDLPPAGGAEEDARSFTEFAEVTLGLRRANIHLLTGALATKSSIIAELEEWLPRNVAREGEVFFFFAGHGAPEPRSGTRFLVPWDADPKFINSQGIAVDWLTLRLARLRATRVIAFIDACFSGAGGRSVLAPGIRPLVVQRASMARPPGRGSVVVFSATGPNEITGVSSNGRGLFSYYLLRALNGEADGDRDGEVTFGEVIDWVSVRVADDARRANRDQHPHAVGATRRVRNQVLTELGRGR